MAFGRFLDFTETSSPAVVELSRVLQGERVKQKRPSYIPQWHLYSTVGFGQTRVSH